MSVSLVKRIPYSVGRAVTLTREGVQQGGTYVILRADRNGQWRLHDTSTNCYVTADPRDLIPRTGL